MTLRNLLSNLLSACRRHLRPGPGALAATLLGLAVLSPAQAAPGFDPLPDVIQPVWYASTVDTGAGMATFSIRFDRAPDLLTVDALMRQADAFQYWTDTASTDPIASTYAGIQGDGPLGTQSVLATGAIPLTGQLSFIWPLLLTDPGPRDPGGWGAVKGQGGYTLAGAMLSFEVPLALLHAGADGQFNYAFETYQYGAWGGIDYAGASGQAYNVPPELPAPSVPEAPTTAMMGLGLLLLALRTVARRHGGRAGAHTG